MQDFFHADTSAITKNSHKAIAAVGIILMLPCLLCFISLFFDFRSLYNNDFTLIRILVIVGCVAGWMISAFLIYVFARNKVKRQSRYTYFELQQDNAILSRYVGCMKSGGKNTLIRQLYIIPFDKVSISHKNGNIIFRGSIRKYEGDSNFLGYHIGRDGLKFDNWWYDNNGFTEVKTLTLPGSFTKKKFITRCFKAAQNRSIRIAEKRREIRLAGEAALKKRREEKKLPKALQRKKPVRRVYTELPTFNRNW
ncbi:MAG: hypothetical protein IJF09_06020 [Ruminiclostridium sp.]|nr:hypothetical protein [Ruminiclostridium sp.]